MIARLVGARRAVEVGTLTGYSRLRIARGLVEGGWLGDRIELRIAPALKTLRRLPHEELVPGPSGGVLLVDNVP